MKKELLRVKDLTVTYGVKGRHQVKAVSDVSFTITRGENLGLVGESGCGKSSLARAVMQLPRPDSGRIIFNGKDLTRMDRKQLNPLRPRFQMVFQDSLSSLNPRRSIMDTVTAPLNVIGKTTREETCRRAREMLVSVGIDPDWGHLRPYQLSGGQCQRIQIARALIAEPDLLICDEPVSSLDVSIQAQIINLLEKLRKAFGLTLLFISHDLAVVKNVCDRVVVMYLGKFCEEAGSEALYAKPYHPYTKALISAIPTPGPHPGPGRITLLPGEKPSSADPPSGCGFHPRCPRAEKKCAVQAPIFREPEPGRRVACHFPIL